jgi:hypothetical protein
MGKEAYHPEGTDCDLAELVGVGKAFFFSWTTELVELSLGGGQNTPNHENHQLSLWPRPRRNKERCL